MHGPYPSVAAGRGIARQLRRTPSAGARHGRGAREPTTTISSPPCGAATTARSSGSTQRYQRARSPRTCAGWSTTTARAEDVTQEVFLSALRRMRETERPIAFKPWIHEIARNACIDHFRRARRRTELSYDAEDGARAPPTTAAWSTRGPAPGRGRRPEAGARRPAAAPSAGLSDAHHQILVLRELEGLSYREIGERLGLEPPAVESTLFRARRRLAEEYEELVDGRALPAGAQAIIATAAQGPVGRRDERRLARHLARCSGCRREAWAAGVATPPRPARRRLGALLPLPAVLRRLVAARTAAHAPQVAGQLGARVDPEVGTWAKAAAAAAALALTGVGAGEVVAMRAARTALLRQARPERAAGGRRPPRPAPPPPRGARAGLPRRGWVAHGSWAQVACGDR